MPCESKLQEAVIIVVLFAKPIASANENVTMNFRKWIHFHLYSDLGLGFLGGTFRHGNKMHRF